MHLAGLQPANLAESQNSRTYGVKSWPSAHRAGGFCDEKERMDKMEWNRQTAEQALVDAEQANPGRWGDQSRYVAIACENIAARCEGMDSELAYLLGLLHDIGRYAGVTSEKHLIDGYRYCMERGWEKAAQVCLTHGFPVQDIHKGIGKFDVSEEEYRFMEEFIENAKYDDYDRLVQLCDALALPDGCCLLEKRFVDVVLRYGVHDCTVERWKKVLEIKEDFEKRMGCSIYDVLPNVVENSLR